MLFIVELHFLSFKGKLKHHHTCAISANITSSNRSLKAAQSVCGCVLVCKQGGRGMGPGLLALLQQHLARVTWFMAPVALSGSVYGFP